MEYRRFGSTVVARIDRGEEILAALQRIAEAEGIRLAEVSALGAVDDFTVGVYDVAEQAYQSHRFEGPFEIVSLTGTVNTMHGGYYAHIHMSAAGADGRVLGGHLNRAAVSATCELLLRCIDGTVDRARDPQTGLNLFSF